ncbi:protein kinase, putative [Trichomonas vaginalis G3]|uniref:Protein kinase, putative n=1 Tax=Trichomonas vaginalis (strain ATCC PRA-98 / G3) TaxID=412133 RepID=A2E436_TRIV3|nr:protein serine/threonine kinase protein [Trichomonas vaginalis G3]EAY12579.1 protein kinase, putative [Trichomonas vaginalis G3]KAI5509404.1 protein serine/threonine kinase protein [Trichomonas vaginalis G3]|eukprot:XP_001324802.1 protein kinase [Trichomonas vaginalis G3]
MTEQFIPPGFIFLKNLNSGFLGPSYLLKKEDTGVNFICKSFLKSSIGDEADVDNFIQIIRMTRKVKESCFLPYHYYYDEEKYIYALRPFFEGLDLASYITNCSTNINVATAQWKVLVRLYRHLHKRKITPIFIKPSNVFMENGTIAFITDIYPPPRQFNATLHRTNPLEVGFLAPEYLSEGMFPGQKSDMWSLGVLLWFMVTKQLPWSMNNVVVMLKTIQTGGPINFGILPPEIRDIAASLLVLSPEKRIDTEQIVHNRANTLVSTHSCEDHRTPMKTIIDSIVKPLRTNTPSPRLANLVNVRRRAPSDAAAIPPRRMSTSENPLTMLPPLLGEKKPNPLAGLLPSNMVRVAGQGNRRGSFHQLMKVNF